MQETKLSVIVPMYNRRDYIARCIDSILGQTLRELEVICVDDGSTDGSAEFCAQRYGAEPRFRLVRQVNAGAGAARNRGLELARGRYVTFVDSDDYLFPDGYAQMYALAEQDQADVVDSLGCYLVRDGEAELQQKYDVPHPAQKPYLLEPAISARLELYRLRPITAVWNKFFRRRFLQEQRLSFQTTAYHEDCLFMIACLFQAPRYVCTPFLYYAYCVSRTSILRQHKSLDDAIIVMQQLPLLARGIRAQLAKVPYFAQHAAALHEVQAAQFEGLLQMLRQWGFYPVPEAARDDFLAALQEGVADSQLTAAEAAWLVAWLCHRYNESQSLLERGAQDQLQAAMEQAYQRIAQSKVLDTAQLVQELEPAFAAAGYRQPVSGAPQRILLLHDAGVGDFVNLSPALRHIRMVWPEAYITLVVYTRSQPLAVTCPYVDQLLVNARRCDWGDALALLRWDIDFAQKLLPQHYDLFINFAHYGSTPLLGYFSGARERVGYGGDYDDFRWAGVFPYAALQPLLTRRVPYQLRQTHALWYYLALAEAATGTQAEAPQPEVWYTPQERAEAEAELARRGADGTWVAVVLGGTDQRRHWPVENYIELLRRLQAEPGGASLRWLVLGGPSDRADGEQLVAALPAGTVWNAAGLGSYRASAALLSVCRAYIGNDTGLMHSAAACGVPVLVPICTPASRPLDRHNNAAVFYPYGVPAVMVQPREPLTACAAQREAIGCDQLGVCHCIRQVTPDLMQRGWHVLLDGIRTGRHTPVFICAEPENETDG